MLTDLWCRCHGVPVLGPWPHCHDPLKARTIARMIQRCRIIAVAALGLVGALITSCAPTNPTSGPIAANVVPNHVRLIFARTASGATSNQALLFSTTQSGSVPFDANDWNQVESARPNGWKVVEDAGANVLRAVDSGGNTLSTIATPLVPPPLPTPGYWQVPREVSPDGSRVFVSHEWFDLASNSITMVNTQIFSIATGQAASPVVPAFRPIWSADSTRIAWAEAMSLKTVSSSVSAVPVTVTTAPANLLCARPTGWTSTDRIVVWCGKTEPFGGSVERVTWSVDATGANLRELLRSTVPVTSWFTSLDHITKSLVIPGTDDVVLSIPEQTTTTFGQMYGLSLFLQKDVAGSTPLRLTSPNPQLVQGSVFTWVDSAEGVYYTP